MSHANDESCHMPMMSVREQPANAKRPKIIAVIGFGGGGHEATVKGVRDVMTEAGCEPCHVTCGRVMSHFNG